MKKLPVRRRARRCVRISVGGVGHDLRRAAPSFGFDARDHLQRRGRDRGARPQALTPMPCGANSLGHGRACTCSCRTWPSCTPRAARTSARFMLSGGDMFSTCGLRPALRRLDQMRQAGLRAQIRAAHVDAEHQVEALHRRFERAASALIALALLTRMSMPPKRSTHCFAAAAHARSRRGCRPASPALCRRPPRSRAAAVWIVPGSFGWGSVGLRGDRDVGAVARGAHADRQADAARCAGDEESFAFECHGGPAKSHSETERYSSRAVQSTPFAGLTR